MTTTSPNEIDFEAIAKRWIDRSSVVDAPPAPTDDDRAKRRVRAMKSAGFETRALALATSTAYDEARASGYLAALRNLDAKPGVAVLAGNPGVGKTAAVARWAYTRASAAPRFLRAAEFFRSSRYGNDLPEGVESRDELLRRPALVLDDVGAEYADANGNYRVDLDELVDRFYADSRILIITTNIVYATPKQRDAAKGDPSAVTFAERYGERITDRLRECGVWVSSAAASMRGAR